MTFLLSLRHALLGGVVLLSFASISIAQAGTIISEDYESYPVGTGTYIGPWQFIYADAGHNTGTVSSLNIGSGVLTGMKLFSGSIYYNDSNCYANEGVTGSLASPAGGKYLFLSTFGIHGVKVLTASGGGSSTYTTNTWESPNGHFYRAEILEAGHVYRVHLWRQIQGGCIMSICGFSVWDGRGLDLANPFDNTPNNNITRIEYDSWLGGWQEVDLTFTVPGNLGDGPIPVVFMMGIYSGYDFPGAYDTYDNDPYTIDLIPELGSGDILSDEMYYYDINRLMIDGFSVTEIPVVANGDSGSFLEGNTGSINILANDTYSGIQANLGNVIVTLTGANPFNVFIDGSGMLIVPNTTPVGLHNLQYQICDSNNTVDCSTAFIVIEIISLNATANPDEITLVFGSGGSINVFGNDLIGQVYNPQSLFTSLNDPTVLSGSSLNNSGIFLIPNSTPIGTYVLHYSFSICDIGSNCEGVTYSNTTTITVHIVEGDILPEITARADSGSFLNTTTGSLVLLGNDIYSGSEANTGSVTVSLTGSNPLTGSYIDPLSGVLMIPPFSGTGMFLLTYEICDRLNVGNCSSTGITVNLLSPGTPILPEITARADSGSFLRTSTGVVTVLSNDTYSGSVANTGNVSIRLTGSISIPGAFIDPISGNLVLPPSSSSGVFTLTYEICDRLNVGNCSSAPVSITLTENVTPPPPVTPQSSGGGGGGSISTIPQIVPSITPMVAPSPLQTQTPPQTPPVYVCVSAIKNLDDPKLLVYYDDLSVIGMRDPDRRLTRAEFLKLIINARKVDLTSVGETRVFYDVRPGTWYNRYVSYAFEQGIISGESKNFRPNDSITRAEASKIFIQSLGAKPLVERVVFSDLDPYDSLTPYVESAYRSCLVHGRHTVDGEPLPGEPRVFEPYDSISLGETAKVLYNATH